MGLSVYNYQLVKQESRNDIFDCLIQYAFQVTGNSDAPPIDYTFNFSRYKSYLYITDYFPTLWVHHVDRANKLLSVEENQAVNFRKITLTCFYIFHQEISTLDENAAFVACGSYLHGEKSLPEIKISRKLKLYLAILKPIAENLGYRIVEIFNLNAFVMIKDSSGIPDEQIRNDYQEFKERGLVN